MADIHPFRALHYNPAQVTDLGAVVTQPYDKISGEMQARYYGLSPHNLVRIIRGRARPEDTLADNVYVRSARDLREWIQSGALVSESEPAIYPYTQEYEVPGQRGLRKHRRGFIALLRLEDYAARVVHRHEETLSGPKTDRLERSPFVLPHNPEFQTGWHSVFYDVAAAPDGEGVYKLCQGFSGH